MDTLIKLKIKNYGLNRGLLVGFVFYPGTFVLVKDHLPEFFHVPVMGADMPCIAQDREHEPESLVDGDSVGADEPDNKPE